MKPKTKRRISYVLIPFLAVAPLIIGFSLVEIFYGLENLSNSVGGIIILATFIASLLLLPVWAIIHNEYELKWKKQEGYKYECRICGAIYEIDEDEERNHYKEKHPDVYAILRRF